MVLGSVKNIVISCVGIGIVQYSVGIACKFARGLFIATRVYSYVYLYWSIIGWLWAVVRFGFNCL